ncbi:inovirus-type Gp2 protein, partial [Escherichia albertii]|nr:inovirus-type Gp2 protein [Escherichia albertii]MCZ8833935.1 inovirus-type Gp2 protein [Escherichia albertii]MCZ8890116.1 inovirus-type Gp2 protein [Escherichia albertii]
VISHSPNSHCGVNQPYARVLSYLSVPQDDFCIVNPGGCIVHFPANGRDILDINDPDFPEQYQRLLARLDYLTKLDTKASGQRNSGYSGF